MNARIVGSLIALALVLAPRPLALAQTAYPASLSDFSLPTTQGRNPTDWGVPAPGRSGGGIAWKEAFPALDPGDRAYDPLELGDAGPGVPSSCAVPGSPCLPCAKSAEENIQFNRRYLHVAWSVARSQPAQPREIYERRYADHMQNIRRSLDELAACEQQNHGSEEAFRLDSQRYYDGLVARYANAGP